MLGLASLMLTWTTARSHVFDGPSTRGILGPSSLVKPVHYMWIVGLQLCGGRCTRGTASPVYAVDPNTSDVWSHLTGGPRHVDLSLTVTCLTGLPSPLVARRGSHIDMLEPLWTHGSNGKMSSIGFLTKYEPHRHD